MENKNFWKETYQPLWDIADIKERKVKKLIEELLNTEVSFYGLGAGQTKFIDGSAEDNNHKKGDADLYIKEYDTFIEVTGPTSKAYEEDSLWVRPDKITNSINKINKGIGKYHFVIHVARININKTIYRAIKLGEHLRIAYKEKSIKLIKPNLKGNIEEKYIEIPYNHNCVYSMEEFKNILMAP